MPKRSSGVVLQGSKFVRTSSSLWILLIPRFWVLGFAAHIKVLLLLLLEFVIATGL
jgi:hypothetical protein